MCVGRMYDLFEVVIFGLIFVTDCRRFVEVFWAVERYGRLWRSCR
jgi:hypothetical protein